VKANPVIGSLIKRRPVGVFPAWAVALALRLRKGEREAMTRRIRKAKGKR